MALCFYFRITEDCLDDGVKLKPKSLYCWLTRVMYQRRSKFDPFWNNIVVGGIQVRVIKIFNYKGKLIT